MVTFVYVVPSSTEDDGVIICIDMILPMGWVDSPKFFYDFFETLTDAANALVDTELPVPAYRAITTIPATRPPHPHTRKSLTHIDCYMDSVISSIQGGPKIQHRVFDGTVCALKWIFPSLPQDSKDSMNAKNSWRRRATRPTPRKFWGVLLKQRREQSP